MKDDRIACIILAAGYSSRMGSFKPLLKLGENSAIEIIIEAYKCSGITDIIVVAGYRGNELAEELKNSSITCLQNEYYPEGMFTSVKAGVNALDASISAFFIQPVDIPLVKTYTIKVLITKYRESGKGIIYPNFCGRTGHPPLIDCKYRKPILRSNMDGGLNKLLKRYSGDSIYVPVTDRAVIMDMNTKDDYEKILGIFKAAAPDQ